MKPRATLEGAGLTKAFKGRRVVDNVSVRVQQGEIVGLLGPNGAGKTTTFYLLVGLTRADEGQVKLDTQDVTRWPMYKRARNGIGYLAQEPSVFRKMTVEENVRAILERRRLPRAEQARVLDQMLEELSIAHLRKSPAYSLSGGERQMLVIGRALLARPRILLLDEPSLGLAPRIVAQIFGLLRRLVDAEGLSVLLVEQNARSALSVADVGVVLNLGRVVATDSARTLLADEGLRHAFDR